MKLRVTGCPSWSRKLTRPTSMTLAVACFRCRAASAICSGRPSVRRKSPPVPRGMMPSSLRCWPAAISPSTTSEMVPSPPKATTRRRPPAASSRASRRPSPTASVKRTSKAPRPSVSGPTSCGPALLVQTAPRARVDDEDRFVRFHASSRLSRPIPPSEPPALVSTVPVLLGIVLALAHQRRLGVRQRVRPAQQPGGGRGPLAAVVVRARRAAVGRGGAAVRPPRRARRRRRRRLAGRRPVSAAWPPTGACSSRSPGATSR